MGPLKAICKLLRRRQDVGEATPTSEREPIDFPEEVV